jgi:hypothetical protein
MIEEQHFKMPRGTVTWWSPARAIICSRVEGHMGNPAPEILINAFIRVRDMNPGVRVKTFHDWQKVTGYDSDARQRYVELSKPLMGDAESIDALVQSRLLAMAIEVARIALGSALRGTADRAEYERRVQEALVAARG